MHNVPTLVGALSEDDTTAPAAILTTDSVEKTAVHEGAGWSIGAMAKGAGMLAPGLATMLVVITTDALLPQAELDTALRHATATTFDRLDSDGCMSTNDTVILLVGPDKVKLVFARGAIAQVEDAGVENEMTQEVVK